MSELFTITDFTGMGGVLVYRAIMAATLLLAAGTSSPLAAQCSNMTAQQIQNLLGVSVSPKNVGPLCKPLPPGWNSWPKGQPLIFDTVGTGYHFESGPTPVIVYRTADSVGGPFHVSATFTQSREIVDSQGYGVFHGGTDLAGPNRRYLSFLIRSDGRYLIRREEGEKTTDLVPWTSSSAIKTSKTQDLFFANTVEIDAKSDPKKIDFKINGQVVSSIMTPDDVKGLVGLWNGPAQKIQIDSFTVKS